MVAVFGLGGRPQDDALPAAMLVEAHPMLDVHQLARNGLLAPGATAILGDGGGRRPALEAGKAGAGESDGERVNYRVLPEGGVIELDGQRIAIGWHSTLPARVFLCPLCQADRYKLSRVGGQWGCRKCFDLDYSSRHRHRTIPSFARLRFLRRRLGASPIPFSPLPRAPLTARKHWRIVLEIRRIETELLEHGRDDIAKVLARRHARSS